VTEPPPDEPRTADPAARIVKELPDRFNELGAFIREQRSSARLSLRRLSELAGISNPYLSQIERGLRRPSAEILQQIAKALRISAETLYVQAGILERPDGDTDLSRHIFADHHLTEEQRQALLRIYLSFRHENEAQADHGQAVSPAPPDASSPPPSATREAQKVHGDEDDREAPENGNLPVGGTQSPAAG
jgi:transcriptional regulator with XRE-family HTH domain